MVGRGGARSGPGKVACVMHFWGGGLVGGGGEGTFGARDRKLPAAC